MNIFLADDDHDDLEIMQEALANVLPGVIINTASSANAALSFLTQVPDNDLPCLVILDYNMPEMNAAQVLSALRAQARYDAIPKVVLSTSNSPLYINECLTNGADGYFVKPNNMVELNALARKIKGFCSATDPVQEDV